MCPSAQVGRPIFLPCTHSAEKGADVISLRCIIKDLQPFAQKMTQRGRPEGPQKKVTHYGCRTRL